MSSGKEEFSALAKEMERLTAIEVTICLSKAALKKLTGKHGWEGYREDGWGRRACFRQNKVMSDTKPQRVPSHSLPWAFILAGIASERINVRRNST